MRSAAIYACSVVNEQQIILQSSTTERVLLNMRRTAHLAFFLIVLTLAVAAQDRYHPSIGAIDEPVKFATLGDVNDSELGENLKRLFDRLDREQRATAYTIVYVAADAPDVDPDNVPMLARIREMVTFQRYDQARFEAIFGGFRSSDTVEFFIVPPGAEAPEPSWTVAQAEIKRNQTFQWASGALPDDNLEEFVNRAVLYRDDADTLYLGEPVFDGPVKITDEPDSVRPVLVEAAKADPPERLILESEPNQSEMMPQIEISAKIELTPEDLYEMRYGWVPPRFAAAIKDRPGARGVVILYADDQFYDIARLQTFVEAGLGRMSHMTAPETSIEVSFGGYRPQPEVEYYVVPAGGAQPEPHPQSR
jgi:hypothetical protein